MRFDSAYLNYLLECCDEEARGKPSAICAECCVGFNEDEYWITTTTMLCVVLFSNVMFNVLPVSMVMI